LEFSIKFLIGEIPNSDRFVGAYIKFVVVFVEVGTNNRPLKLMGGLDVKQFDGVDIEITIIVLEFDSNSFFVKIPNFEKEISCTRKKIAIILKYEQ